MRWVLFTGFHAVSSVKYSEIYSFVASSRCGVTLKHKHFFLEQKKKTSYLSFCPHSPATKSEIATHLNINDSNDSDWISVLNWMVFHTEAWDWK